MSLKHELRIARRRVPELNAAILTTGQHPPSIRSECNTKHKVLVTFESADTLATLWHLVGTVAHASVVGLELPHTNSPIQRARHELTALRRKSNRVDTVLVTRVAISFLKALEEVASLHVPDANTLVKRTSSQESVVGRNGDSGDTVFNGKAKHTLVALDIPQTDCAIAGSGSDVATVGRVVEGVDVLLVTCKSVPDSACLNLPDL